MSARFNISVTNFGTTANINPVGWTFTGLNMNIDTVGPSNGNINASGGAYLSEGSKASFINTAGNLINRAKPGVSTATLQTSSLDITNIRVSFALQRSTTYNNKATYVLEWSSDSINYTPINFKVIAGTNWNYVKGTGLTLPAAADDQPTLFLRWTFIRTGGTRAYLKIDDFELSGDSICKPAVILLQPVTPIPACVNTDSIVISTLAEGSALLTYQWQLDSVNITNGGNYYGCNAATLVILNPQYDLNGKTVRCLVTNCKGSVIVFTNAVSLTINALATDINKDGMVNNDDFLLFNSKWDTNCNGCPEDITKDGNINVEDFLILLGDFSKTCQ